MFMLLCLAVSAVPKKIKDDTAEMERHPGYFSFYWDEKYGKIWLEIDKFDVEFLYVSSLRAGLGANEVGLDRNQLGSTRIVKFQRMGPKVLLIQPNYAFRAISEDEDERKAVEESFAQSVLWGFSIEAQSREHVLVDATAFFLQDVHKAAGRLPRRDQEHYRLDQTRSAIYMPRTKNFPNNTEVEALLTFVWSEPGTAIRDLAPSPGVVTLQEHHSFIKLPDSEYRPRAYDPRSNFDEMSFMDFSSPLDESLIRRFICRHRLKKKDPRAKMSDPVDPIVYYVDRGVPEPVRSALIEGAGWWNEAFEAIGYRGAFQVKLLPEGADPMDVRYNMINWVHRSTRGWSYGSAVIDPRTGEIIKGHIALGSQRLRQDHLIARGLVGDYDENGEFSDEMTEMALARIRQLSCHEVGHTLGLGHNFAASVDNRASVMDYPHPQVLIREDGSLDLSEAYTTGVGEWDRVSIAYGYQDIPDGVDEEKELKAILNDAFSSGLHFLAGQDAGPGSAHPLANVWDNGKDPVNELKRVMRIRSLALRRFSERKIPVGAPMATLEEVLVPVYYFHRYQTEAAASVLGGLYYNHTLRGGVQKNPEIVPASEQWRALDVLLDTIRPEALAIDEKTLQLIPPRPPGYMRGAELFPGQTGLTFDPLGAAESAADITIDLILHPERAARMVEYHSRREDCPGLVEVLDKLISYTWRSTEKTGFMAEIQRRIDHVFLFRLLQLAANEDASAQVRAIAFLKIEELREWLKKNISSAKSSEHKAHCLYALSRITIFQKDPSSVPMKPPLHPPAGAPIGGSGLVF
jgi:hypothetical protein